MEDGYPPKNWYPHTRLFYMIIERTTKQQHEEFITNIVGVGKAVRNGGRQPYRL
jgi:hypothetical protein